jgi:hypothetical protein
VVQAEISTLAVVEVFVVVHGVTVDLTIIGIIVRTHLTTGVQQCVHVVIVNWRVYIYLEELQATRYATELLIQTTLQILLVVVVDVYLRRLTVIIMVVTLHLLVVSNVGMADVSVILI